MKDSKNKIAKEKTKMNEERIPRFELIFMIIGEIIVSLAICGVYLIIGKFSLSVPLGAALGSAVTVFNFVFLIISTNRTIDKIMAERGEGEMDEEEAAEFSAKHVGALKASAKISYIVRMASLVGTLILALLLKDVFGVIPTLIPLLMLRPLLTAAQLAKAKRGK